MGTDTCIDRRSPSAENVVMTIATLDGRALARVAVAWFARLTELAKTDPFEAGRLASAMYAHLAAHRPESPAPLDAGFTPTEVASDPRGSR